MRTMVAVGSALFLFTAIAAPMNAWAEDLEESPGSEEALESGSNALGLQGILDDRRNEEPSRGDLSPEEVDELTALMSGAIQAERSDDPGRARELYIEAYEIYPHSNILLALGRTSAEMEDYETAVQVYERYVERNPEGEQTPQVEALIEEYREILGPLEEEDVAGEDSPPFWADMTLPQPTVLGWAGAGLTVLGVGSMIAGGVTASRVDGRFGELESALQVEDREEYDRLADEISRGQTRGRVFLYGGMVLTAGGVGLLVYDLLLSDAEPPAGGGDGPAVQIETGPGGSLQVGIVHRF